MRGVGGEGGDGRGRMYRVSHSRPSVAVCFFAFSSLRTRSWRFSESTGDSSCLSLTFCHAVLAYILQPFTKLSSIP